MVEPIFIIISAILFVGLAVMVCATAGRIKTDVVQLIKANATMRVKKPIPLSFMAETKLVKPGFVFVIIREDGRLIWCRDHASGNPFVITHSAFAECLQEDRLDRV